MGRDIRKRCHQIPKQQGDRAASSSPPNCEKKRTRGKITGPSKGAARRLIQHIRNAEGLKTFASLTYPASVLPVTPPERKNHLRRLRRYLHKLGVSDIAVWEGSDERPHLHLALDRHVTAEELWPKWREIISDRADKGQKHGVHTTAVFSQSGLAAYLSKSAFDDEVEHLTGRFWSASGRLKSLNVILEITGTESENAKYWREARNIVDARLKKKGNRCWRDSGTTGYVLLSLTKHLLDAHPELKPRKYLCNRMTANELRRFHLAEAREEDDGD
jgi:hypothetical protein